MKRIDALMVAGMMVGCSAPAQRGHVPAPACEAKAKADPGAEGVIFLVKADKAFTKENWRRFTFTKIILHGKVGSPDIELITENTRNIIEHESGPHSRSPTPDDPKEYSDEVDLGFLGQMTRTEKFKNTATDIRDAEWFVPGLAESEPITDLVITIGHRKLRAVVVDAVQAAQLYALAVHEGRRAVMVKADADGWRLRLGQIRPGEDIETQMNQAWCWEETETPQAITAVQSGIRFTAESKPVPNDKRPQEERGCPVAFIRAPAPGVADSRPEAFPILHALWASREINRLLALDRASGRPDHAKQAYEIAREAKIVSPVSSLLMVDVKGEKK